jgi:uncharacterized protein (TIGR03086 family)
MSTIDLGPAAERMSALIRSIPDDALTRPTPCPDYSLGDLVDHVGGFAIAFTAAAQKDMGGVTAQGGAGDASRLTDDWRTRIPAELDGLAAAWRADDAWTGMTRAGGVELPGEIAGLVALDELVLHGWDVARASGQRYEVDRASLEAVHDFVLGFSQPGDEASREGLFGPVVPVDGGAPLLDRVVGLAGRDPNWSAR